MEAKAMEADINTRVITTPLRVFIPRRQAVAHREHTRNQCSGLWKDAKAAPCQAYPPTNISGALKARGHILHRSNSTIANPLLTVLQARAALRGQICFVGRASAAPAWARKANKRS